MEGEGVGDGNQRDIFQPAEGSRALTQHTLPLLPADARAAVMERKANCANIHFHCHKVQQTCQEGELGKTAKEQLFPEENMK